MKTIFYFKIFLISFVYLLMITACNNQIDEKKRITVVFRFDDPSALSSTETELKVIDVFREHNASLTFGVIPFKCIGSTRDVSPQELVPLDAKKASILHQAVQEGVVDIALHGYSHQMRDTKLWTEFQGMDYGEQKQRLAKGKNYLETLIGTSIDTFIPPYNTYDLNTLKALESVGFTTLSAGIRGDVSKDSQLKFMPMTIRIHQVKTAIEEARESLDAKPLIVVMFHEYDFLDVKVEGIQKKLITIEDLNQLLTWLRAQHDVDIVSLKNAKKQINDVSSKRFESIKRYDSYKSIIPGFQRKSAGVYPEVSTLFSILLKTLTIYLLILLTGFFSMRVILCPVIYKVIKNNTIKIVSLSVLIMLPLIYTIGNLSIQAKELGLYLLLVGGTIGLFWCVKKRDKL